MRLAPLLTAFTIARNYPARHSTKLLMSTTADIQHINRQQMHELIEKVQNNDKDAFHICIIDVRNPDEIAYTGKLAPEVHTLPLPYIMQNNAFDMDAEDFEEAFDFPKPALDGTTLVFSCAAGIRSVYACQFAAKAGYSKLVNYMGGSNEWFSS